MLYNIFSSPNLRYFLKNAKKADSGTGISPQIMQVSINYNLLFTELLLYGVIGRQEVLLGDVEQHCLAHERLKLFGQKHLATHPLYRLHGIVCNTEPYTSAIEQHPFLLQVVERTRHGIGAHFNHLGVFTHRWNASRFGVCAQNYVLANAFGDLKVYRLVFTELYHNFDSINDNKVVISITDIITCG